MKFNSQICTTRLQSEKLLALGLKPETADMCHFWHWESDDYSRLCASWEFAHRSNKDIPAWSLHRLIEMCDVVIRVFKKRISLSSGEGFNAEETLYDNLINCIEWLIKEGYFPKEYLV